MTALQKLIRKWRRLADSVSAAGYSQQGDRINDCADDLEDAIRPKSRDVQVGDWPTSKELADNLEACVNDAMLGRGQTLSNLQRRLGVDAVMGMRLLALQSACYAAIAALTPGDTTGQSKGDQSNAS